MKPEELEEYLTNIVEDLDGKLIEKPGDDYYLVEVTKMREGDDEVLHFVEGAQVDD